jgi:parallel beta-helix repeat protein
MSKSKLILTLTLAAAIVILSTPNAQADTEVGGPITSDTTWTAANSPYIVTEDVEVVEGVTLTVEPGVTVKFDSEKKLAVNGDLIAKGVEGNPITFTSNQTRPAPGDWATIQFSRAATTTMDAEGNYVSGSVLQYCVVEYAGFESKNAIDTHRLLIDHCIVRDNDAQGIFSDSGRISNSTITRNYDTGIEAEYSTIISNTIEKNYTANGPGGIYTDWGAVIRNNVISDNHAQADGGGIYFYTSYFTGLTTVSDNIISGNSAGRFGGGIYAKAGGGGCGSVITGNTISNNTVTGGGAGIYHWGTVDILRNNIVGNSGPSRSNVGGLEVLHHISSMRPCPPAQIHYNHISDNYPYDISVTTGLLDAEDINGTYNYWGTTSSEEIAERIYDYYDDDTLGKFHYTPYLLGPVGSNHWVYLPIVHYSQ